MQERSTSRIGSWEYFGRMIILEGIRLHLQVSIANCLHVDGADGDLFREGLWLSVLFESFRV